MSFFPFVLKPVRAIALGRWATSVRERQVWIPATEEAHRGPHPDSQTRLPSAMKSELSQIPGNIYIPLVCEFNVWPV
jgi:hypothetical protein